MPRNPALIPLALLFALTSTVYAQKDMSGSLVEQVQNKSGGGVPKIEGAPVKMSDPVPNAGHKSSFHPSEYNIWSVNCHTESNLFAAMAFARGVPGGILACKGTPQTSPGYHTAAWAQTPEGQTCIYNYGRPCCWDGTALPPNIESGRGLQCAQQACGNQYVKGVTRVMPPGELVESPGSHVCATEAAGAPLTILPGAAIDALSERVRTGAETIQARATPTHPDGATLTFTPDRLKACLKCCGGRAGMWSGAVKSSPNPAMHQARQQDFQRSCQTACRAVFK